MISRIGLLKKLPEKTMEEFQSHWYNVHGPIGARMKNLRRYEQNVVKDNEQRSPFGRGPLEIDGYSELWFDSIHDMNEGAASLGTEAKDDLKYFAEDDVKILVLAKKRDFIVPNYLKNRKLIKRMSFLGRAPHVTAEQFQYEWWNVHSDLVKTMRGFVGYNQNLVIDRIINGQSVPYEKLPVAGVVEFWFEDMDAFNETYSTPEFERTAAHGKEFISDITTYIVEAYPVDLP